MVTVPEPTWVASAQRPTQPTPTMWPTSTPTSGPTVSATATSTESPESPPTVETIAPSATVPITPTPTRFVPPPPIDSVNYLPNPSFELGWYNLDGIPELQVPNKWRLEWDAGENPLDPESWNQLVRPESRLLNGDFLPAEEHQLFIWDGAYTLKIFKGSGALSFRLLTETELAPGFYLFTINVFPDMVGEYDEEGHKIWAPDPLSGEIRFVIDEPMGDWILPTFGQKETFYQMFEVPELRTVRLGVAFRGRWAILNNGWFMDDWSVRRVEPPGLSSRGPLSSGAELTEKT